MRKRIIGFVIFGLAVASAPAQIIGVELASNEARAKYAKWTIEKEGRRMIVGEIVSGVSYDREARVLQRKGKKVVIAVPDPAKPELPVAEDDGKGGRKIAEHRTVSLDEREVQDRGLHLVFEAETCAGLRAEYLRKHAEVDERRKKLDGHKVGSPEWFVLHRAMVSQMDALAGWLNSTLFPVAGARLQKEYEAEVKRAGAAGSQSRLEAAKKSLRNASIPDALIAAAPSLKWHSRETQHVRAVAAADVPVANLDAGLMLAERIIEGFRRDFIDPYLAVDESDPVSDKLFVEFFFCPDNIPLSVKLWEEYYGKKIGEPRAELIQMTGRSARFGNGVDHVRFTRTGGSQEDIEGFVAHGMGHVMAEVAFNRGGRGAEVPAWLDEGFAYWISFTYISRNSTTCFQFHKAEYGREAQKEGMKTVQQGVRAAFNMLALEKGASLSELLQMKLADMSDADFAKAWSLVDYIVMERRPKVMEIFRAACTTTDIRGKTDIERFRPELMKAFEIKEGDIYTAVEKLWKTYAGSGQKVERKK